MSLKRQTGIYTLLFAVTLAGVLFVFWSADRTMLRYSKNFPDSLAQSYTFLVGFKHYLKALFSGKLNNWSWSIGLGADAYSFYSSKLFNPLYWITAMVLWESSVFQNPWTSRPLLAKMLPFGRV